MAQNRVLYWGSGSAPAWRVQAALAEKNLKYESKLISFSNKEHKSPEILALNPRGQVPTFKDGETTVNESLAAVLYLDKQYPEPSLIPDNLAAEVLQRTFESNNVQAAFRPILLGKEEDASFAEAVEALKKELSYWESYLGKGKFLVGDQFTAADIAFGPWLLAVERQGAAFKNFPKLAQYVSSLKARPSIKDNFPPHWAETPSPTKLANHI